MQRQLGRTGILAAFRPPFADFQYTNYQILLNMLPELRKAFVDSYALGRLASEYGATVQETMLRHLGEIDECETNLGKEVRNPFVWLREGARTILAIPLYLLQWFGIISESITDKVTGNFIFRMLSSVAVIVGFIGSVITIVLGWEQFSRMMNISSFSSFLTQRQVHGVQTPSTTHQTTQTSLQPNPSAAAAPNTASGSQAPSRINR
ncbi:MAG: hypothetical protein A2075_21740 [Geobacteraceae bacterium GWC2_58_44]|nr:MAG: hypothetical protein A2075_21740 [Geobacteraceae bacterium GWC2_58_44]